MSKNAAPHNFLGKDILISAGMISVSSPSDRRDSGRFTKRDQAPASFVPQDQLYALQALPQRDPADFAQFRVVL